MTSGAVMWDVIGWGDTQSGGPTSTVLLEVEISVADNEDCKKTFANLTTENMICTKIQEGKATCNVIYLFKT